jgi:CRP-like cAMP-binding protein
MVDLQLLLPIFDSFASLGQFSDAEKAIVAEHGEQRKYKAGEFLLRPGQICKHVGFLYSGVTRSYVIDAEQNELIRGFQTSGSFITDLDSLLLQRPSIEYWEFLSDSEVFLWDQNSIDFFEKNIQNWVAIHAKLTHFILLNHALERTEMFNDDATTRYQKFVARYPDVVRVAPQRMIANYLGIAPQSLSRIRNQLLVSTQKNNLQKISATDYRRT